METIIIQTQSKSNRKLLLELTKKIGEKALVLDNDIADEILFGKMMNEKKTGKLVSKENVLSGFLLMKNIERKQKLSEKYAGKLPQI